MEKPAIAVAFRHQNFFFPTIRVSEPGVTLAAQEGHHERTSFSSADCVVYSLTSTLFGSCGQFSRALRLPGGAGSNSRRSAAPPTDSTKAPREIGSGWSALATTDSPEGGRSRWGDEFSGVLQATGGLAGRVVLFTLK